jgi:hypothetical protein
LVYLMVGAGAHTIRIPLGWIRASFSSASP